jgi:hypothetical protein
LLTSLQEENRKLKSTVEEKDSKINDLLDMKRQDTQIIIGLKDIISSLTFSLQQKEQSFQDIHDKYVRYS